MADPDYADWLEDFTNKTQELVDLHDQAHRLVLDSADMLYQEAQRLLKLADELGEG